MRAHCITQGICMKRLKPITLILLIFTALLLVGCTNPLELGPPSSPQHYIIETPDQRAADLNALRRFEAVGAFSVRLRGSQRIISFDSYYRSRNNYALQLSTAGDLYRVVLKNTNGQITYSKDASHYARVGSLHQFMNTEMGWYIPLDDFYYWLRGMALPGSNPVAKYDGFGHLIKLVQDGWTIEYGRYINYGNVDLPTMMSIQSPQGDRIRVAVKQWVLFDMPKITSQDELSRQNRELLDAVTRNTLGS